ncbi:MAG TPA: hypothetical protein VEA19_05810, partial [Actinomycetota bacterium]|nr:hypothetical protein [Actinomycetota bacterium]
GIRDTIMQGREGTPMPSWSIRFEGPMNDQQIQDLINYIVSIQDVPDDQNLCRDPTLLNEPEAGPTPAPTPAGGTQTGGAQTSPTPPAPQTQPSPAEAA